MSGPTVWAILAMALATYATRIAGFLVGHLLPASGPLRRALDALPVAVLTALTAPVVLSGRAEMAGAAVAGAAVAAALSLRLPMLAALVGGIATVALMQALSQAGGSAPGPPGYF